MLRQSTVSILALLLCGLCGIAPPRVIAQDVPASSSSAPVPVASAPLVVGRDFTWVTPPHRTPLATHQVIAFVNICTRSSQAFLRVWDDWIASPPRRTIMTVSPGIENPLQAPSARMLFALQHLGGTDLVTRFAASALADERLCSSATALRGWLVRHGVSVKDYTTTINSNAIIERTVALPDIMQAYGIARLPAIVIDGRYRIIGHRRRMLDVAGIILKHTPLP